MRAVEASNEVPRKHLQSTEKCIFLERASRKTAHEHFIKKRERVRPRSWRDICSQCWPWATSIGCCPEEQWGWYLSVQFVFGVFSEPWLRRCQAPCRRSISRVRGGWVSSLIAELKVPSRPYHINSSDDVKVAQKDPGHNKFSTSRLVWL